MSLGKDRWVWLRSTHPTHSRVKKSQWQDDIGPYEHDGQSAQDGGILNAVRHGGFSPEFAR
jgi:hypothetical protein